MDAPVQIAPKITGEPLVSRTGVYQEEGNVRDETDSHLEAQNRAIGATRSQF